MREVYGDGHIPREQEEGLFRIVQEALNNVSKHARTGEAAVTLQMATGTVSLLVLSAAMFLRRKR